VLLPLLCQGKREAASAYLQQLHPASGEVPPVLEEALRYLDTKRDWMRNYHHWLKQGYPVGGGLVERAIAVVINIRMNQHGMPWKQVKATIAVALSTHRINVDCEAREVAAV
jgi:hypothetical protein